MSERPPSLTGSHAPIASAVCDSARPRARRAAWRQRLVEAERGLVEGVRGDSTFFVYFFLGAICIAAALVLGLSRVEWLLLCLALSLVWTAEMFHQMAKSILTLVPAASDSQVRKILRLGTAAVFLAIGGATTVVVVLFGTRILDVMPQ